MDGARLSEPRRIPGRIISAPPEPESDSRWKLPDSGTLEDYVNNAKVWRERLAQFKSWLDRLDGGATKNDDSSASDSWEERLKRIAAERGYSQVNANHLITDSPTLLISNLLADKVKDSWLPDETLSISAKNLSTQPRLVSAPAEITITSSQQTVHLALQAGQTTQLKAHYRGIPADDIGASLKRGDSPAPLSGGTVDVAFAGTYSAQDGTIDWPLKVTLHDTKLTVAGRTFPVTNFDLPIAVAGSLSSPQIKMDGDQLTRMAKQAGVKILQDEASKKLSEKAGGLLNGLLGGKKDKADPPK